MKSHLIPDPEPLDRKPREQWADRKTNAASRLWLNRKEDRAVKDLRREPELPMRNFLRVVFAQ